MTPCTPGNKPHPIVLHMSIGTALLISGLSIAIGIAILFAGVSIGESTETERKPLRRLGTSIGSPDIVRGDSQTMEATYGPINKSALHEAKEGLLQNIRARRSARQQPVQVTRYQATAQRPPCVPCNQGPPSYPAYPAPNRQPSPLPSTLPLAPYRIMPEVPVATQPPTAPAPPLNRVDCLNCLDIRPSTQGSTQAAILESYYGPLNKSALQQVKQSEQPAMFEGFGEFHIVPSE